MAKTSRNSCQQMKLGLVVLDDTLSTSTCTSSRTGLRLSTKGVHGRSCQAAFSELYFLSEKSGTINWRGTYQKMDPWHANLPNELKALQISLYVHGYAVRNCSCLVGLQFGFIAKSGQPQQHGKNKVKQILYIRHLLQDTYLFHILLN